MPDKIIDFESHKGKRKKSRSNSIFSLYMGPRGKIATFFTALFVELVFVSFFLPGAITSYFFAPTMILVAVLATVGLRRFKDKYEVNRLYKEMMERKAREEKDGQKTIH